MRMMNVAKICLAVLCLNIIAPASVFSIEQEKKQSIKFQSYSLPPGFDDIRADALGKALDFQNWTKTELMRVAPKINKLLITDPKLATEESISYSHVQFGQIVTGKGKWSWKNIIENKQAVPKELPPDLKENYMKKLTPEQRSNSYFVRDYLKRKLEKYQRTQSRRLMGEMRVEATLAPSSTAAQEYLLASMTDNMMPTETLIKKYTVAKGPEGLGTKSYVTESRRKDAINIMMVRDNICLNVSANGSFVGEAMPLAKKLDDMIVAQPPLSNQQFMSAIPSVTILEPSKEKLVPYKIKLSPSQEIVSLQASVDGQSAAVKDGHISLASKKGKVTVKLIAVTQELLAGFLEKQMSIGE